MAFTAESVSILNGQDVVDVNSAESIENIKAGDFLQIGSFPLVEIKQAYKNGQGQKFIQLIKAWELTTQNNQPAIVIPTSGEFRAAVKALQDANILVNDNQQALQDYQNNLGTVTFKKSDGTTTTVKTLKQIEADNQAQMNSYHPYPWAMRKVEFEALRAANNEKYAANGFVHFGKSYSKSANTRRVIEGLTCFENNMAWSNQFMLGSDNSSNTEGSSKLVNPLVCIAGVLTHLRSVPRSDGWLGNNQHFVVKLPPAEDGTRTYDSVTGESVKHSTATLAFASETETNKVVTDRVDVWGIEAFLREVNDNDPFVYKNGLIQSLASDINGVTTVSDTIRPVTYFAWYEGDTTSRGKGVNWQTATEAQRIAIASDPTNNIYFDDATGKFYQWSIRGRSFAGISNGDWSNVDPNNALNLVSNKGAIVTPQGTSDTGGFGTTWATSYGVYRSEVNKEKGNLGLFTPALSSGFLTDRAVDGQCFFLVCGTVNRKNQGAYHLSFNPLGSARISLLDANGNSNGNDSFWYSSGGAYGTNPFESGVANNTVSCFVLSDPRGNIVGNRSGRPDGRFYDVIDASGQGGVCRDMRYSAWGLKPEDFAQEDLKIKSGEYRGREVLEKTKVFNTDTTTGTATSGVIPGYTYKIAFWKDLGLELQSSENYYVVNQQTGELFYTNNDSRFMTSEAANHVYYPTSWGDSPDIIVVRSFNTNYSVGGEFTHTEVIGDPSDILLCDDLKDGWAGSWNPLIPSGQIIKVPWSRPVLETPGSGSVVYTVNSGDSWGVGSSGIWLPVNSQNESATVELTAGIIVIASYKTKAKMTTPSTSSDLHGSISDVNYLFTSMDASDSKGRLLNFSLTGLIQTHTANVNKVGLETIRLESLPLIPSTGGFWGLNISAGELRHSPLSLDSPSNNSPAFKALNYNVAKNQQGFINYAYAQLTYDATAGDWGDDGKIHIADKQTTMPDENGHTVLVGTARCVEPLGWIKNDK